MLVTVAENRTESCPKEKSVMISKSGSGFTLIEIVLAVSILAMVIAVISTSFRIGINAWEKGESKIESLQTKRAVNALIYREIKSVYPYTITPGELDTHLKYNAFFGESDSLKFVSHASTTGRSTGLSLIEMWTEEDKGLFIGEREAIVSNLSDLNDIDLRDEDTAVSVCREIKKISFRYFERKNKDEEGEWQENWDPKDKKERLPLFVEILLVYIDDNDEESEELLVVPIIAAS
jgi:general secretion pathway protein J